MLLFLFFIGALCSPNYDCDARTKVFTEHGASNKDNFYTVFETYMVGSTNECANVPSRPTFINKLPACSWSHCSHDGWKCPINNVDCYHIEHIIPKTNDIPGLAGCDMNIYGNVIMSYGLWNAQLGNKFLPEKHLIYGDIFLKAYNAVYKCCYDGILPPL